MVKKMDKKPTITDDQQLTDAVAHYRRQLGRQNSALENLLTGGKMERVNFSELIENFELIFFDAYGVLNRGSNQIPGAVEAVERCRQLEIAFLVVSNNASEGASTVWQKLQKMGFSIDLDQIITSGLAVTPFVDDSPLRGQPYLLIGTQDSARDYAPEPDRLLINPPNRPIRTDIKPAYVLICSNRDYYGTIQQQEVENRLAKGPLPLLVANPDMVVQNELREPVVVAGYTAHELAEKFGGEILGIGKPFSPVYQLALQRYPNIDRKKILMVGDSLTTDILGGAAMGFSTCLTLSGLHGDKREQIESFCGQWSIQPDYIVESIGDQ
jgi:glycerol-1-phosphatase